MILYTRHLCSACDNVKKYLRENKVTFEEVNIMEDMAKGLKLIEAGIRSVPVLELESGERFVGAAEINTQLAGR